MPSCDEITLIPNHIQYQMIFLLHRCGFVRERMLKLIGHFVYAGKAENSTRIPPKGT